MNSFLKFLLIVLTVTLSSSSTFAGPLKVEKNQAFGIKDGWYEATVKYNNWKTGTSSTYVLNVYVEYGTVKKIDFGNGGSVHSGFNNEGYLYSGGTLSFQRDYNGNITKASTSVTVSDSNGMRTFNVSIE